jgi:hypothetical protein
MFTTTERISEVTGVFVEKETLYTAQWMIEAYIGKTEAEIDDAGDRALLERALTFQTIYVNGQAIEFLEQVAVKSTTLGESQMVMNLELMAPYMSPFAVLLCKRVSWMGTRSVHTGPIFDRARPIDTWVTD